MNKTQWLNMEDFIAMMEKHTSLKSDVMNKTVDDFNAGKITMDQVKKVIASARKIDVAAFIRGEQYYMEDLESLYMIYINNLDTSLEHKRLLLWDVGCFVRWVEENYPDRVNEI